jgi:hypothetical protein
MKQLAWLLLTVALVPGCVHLPWGKEEAPPPPAPKHAPVNPEQVKESNAHRLADSLDEEVTIDETTAVPKPPPPDDKANGQKPKK